MVKSTVGFGGGKWAVAGMDMKRLGTRQKGNIKKNIWTGGRARNMEKKN